MDSGAVLKDGERRGHSMLNLKDRESALLWWFSE